jgi:hypothetical protein
MVGVESTVKFRLLFVSEADFLRDFSNGVPNVFDELDAFRDA